jgi:hypothetical protein
VWADETKWMALFVDYINDYNFIFFHQKCSIVVWAYTLVITKAVEMLILHALRDINVVCLV